MKISTALSLTVLFSATVMAQSAATVSMSGIFGSTTPTNAYMAPNKPWSLTIQVANPPAVTISGPTHFETTYTNAVYTLNGATVSLPGSKLLVFHDSSITSLAANSFYVCLDAACAIQLYGTPGGQFFSGTTANPTLVPGTYQYTRIGTQVNGNPDASTNLVDGNNNPLPNTLVVAAVGVGVTPSPTPIPSTAWLMTMGLAVALIVFARRSRRQVS